MSRLISLEPEGVGTGMIEAFSCYFHRLSALHGTRRARMMSVLAGPEGTTFSLSSVVSLRLLVASPRIDAVVSILNEARPLGFSGPDISATCGPVGWRRHEVNQASKGLHAASEHRDALTQPLLEALQSFCALTQNPLATYDDCQTLPVKAASGRRLPAKSASDQRVPRACSRYGNRGDPGVARTD